MPYTGRSSGGTWTKLNISSVHSGASGPSDYNLIIMLHLSDPIIISNHQVKTRNLSRAQMQALRRQDYTSTEYICHKGATESAHQQRSQLKTCWHTRKLKGKSGKSEFPKDIATQLSVSHSSSSVHSLAYIVMVPGTYWGCVELLYPCHLWLYLHHYNSTNQRRYFLAWTGGRQVECMVCHWSHTSKKQDHSQSLYRWLQPATIACYSTRIKSLWDTRQVSYHNYIQNI